MIINFEMQSTFKYRKLLNGIRTFILHVSIHYMAIPFAAWFRKVQFPRSVKELLAFPEGSLARNMGERLLSKGLKPIKYFEMHDAKHLLWDYPMNDEGEIKLQYFQLGAGIHGPGVLLSVVFGTLLYPERFMQCMQELRRGLLYPNRINWQDPGLLSENLEELRHKIFTPISTTTNPISI